MLQIPVISPLLSIFTGITMQVNSVQFQAGTKVILVKKSDKNPESLIPINQEISDILIDGQLIIGQSVKFQKVEIDAPKYIEIYGAKSIKVTTKTSEYFINF